MSEAEKMEQQQPNGQRRRERPPPMAGGLWDVRDVAHFLRCSTSWVYATADSGELPSRKIRGLLRFDPDEVRAFANGEAPTTGRVVVPLKKEG